MNGGGQAIPTGLLQQLDDIKGLAKISWWPLAPGWWVVLAAITVGIVVGILFYRRQLVWRRSWKAEARRLLSDLETKLDDANAQMTAAALSTILRRIAVQKFSRAECAGLEGQQWLAWLKAHDPRQFDWVDAGLVLIEAPYAPSNLGLTSASVRPLIRATKKWVQ